MTIDKAIELLTLPPITDGSALAHDMHQAILMGFSALKLIKALRASHPVLIIGPLPGETAQ